MEFFKPIRKSSKALRETIRNLRCLCCNGPADGHHVKTKGSGGPDEEWNLMPLCRQHHAEVHQIGLSRMSESYFQIERWLKNNDWEFDSAVSKWRHHDG